MAVMLGLTPLLESVVEEGEAIGTGDGTKLKLPEPGALGVIIEGIVGLPTDTGTTTGTGCVN